MGDYTPKCDISGLEIRLHETCYVSQIRQYDELGFKLYTPPIKGIYHGDSILTTVDSESFLATWGIKINGVQEWAPCPEGDTENYTFWMSETAFNAFGVLIEDDSFYDGQEMTLRDTCQEGIDDIKREVDKAYDRLSLFEGVMNHFKENGIEEKADMTFQLFGHDLSRTTTAMFIDRDNMLVDLIRNRAPLDDYFLGYERAYLTVIGMMAIRRSIVPQEFYRGPQGGNESAMTLFYELVLHDLHERQTLAELHWNQMMRSVD